MQLVVKDISLQFGGVFALAGVSVEVKKGNIHAIIGPNGAGKTSLLNTISGLYKPVKGTICFEGQDITTLPVHERPKLGISRTFQNIELFRHMTVLENLMLGRHLHMNSGLLHSLFYLGRAEQEEIAHRETVEHIIDFLEIENIRRKKVGTLSYGLQKRVELGRALALNPKLLLLDEPMAGMNSEEKEDMARFILDISEEKGTTIILIEHDMGVVMDISDQVTVLDFGRKIGEGTPEEVQKNPAVIKAYLGEQQVV